jgi:hypothetical protein
MPMLLSKDFWLLHVAQDYRDRELKKEENKKENKV